MPAAPIADGGAAVFDLNNAEVGGDITHAAGSADVVINAAGTYYVQYSANVAPVGTANFPVTNIVTFSVNGQTVNAGAGTAQFAAASPSKQVVAAAVIDIPSAPATLQVISSGGNFIYSAATINVFKV